MKWLSNFFILFRRDVCSENSKLIALADLALTSFFHCLFLSAFLFPHSTFVFCFSSLSCVHKEKCKLHVLFTYSDRPNLIVNLYSVNQIRANNTKANKNSISGFSISLWGITTVCLSSLCFVCGTSSQASIKTFIFVSSKYVSEVRWCMVIEIIYENVKTQNCFFVCVVILMSVMGMSRSSEGRAIIHWSMVRRIDCSIPDPCS